MDLQTQRLMMAAAGAAGDKTYVDDLFSTYLYRGDASTIIVNNGIALGSSMSGNSINLSDTSENERLTRTSALSGVSAGKTFTVSAWVFIPNTGTYGQLFYVDTGSQTRFEIGFGNYIQISARNGSNTKFLDVYTASNVPITPGQWNHILVSMDLTNTSNRHVYVNDSSVSMTYAGYGNEDILFNESKVSIFGQDDNNSKLFGHLSNFYFDQTYRNLGTTSNRRLFYAADGTPATGQASLSPVIYYSFDTLSTTNAGSGGDFTFVDSPTLGTFGPYKDTNAANGGLVWIKNRDTTGYGHFLFDTVRGATKTVCTNLTNAEFTEAKGVKDFNVNGFTIGGASGDAAFNGNNTDYASFTFRKAPGFFDVVEYTGNSSSSSQTISHSLGCVPGMIIVKSLGNTESWSVYHRKLNGGVNAANYILLLDSTSGENASSSDWNNTAPTSSSFTVGIDGRVNGSGDYVAYLFAHDEQSFGDAGNASVIKCGSFTTDSNGAATIDLGWEPQWVLHKASSTNGGWSLIDNMRGWPVEGINTTWLNANTNGAENNSNSNTSLTSTGFKVHLSAYWQNMTRIFVAIRRPDGYVGKPPELGTDVFAMDTGASSTTIPNYDSGFPVDFGLVRSTGLDNWQAVARLMSKKALTTDQSSAEYGASDATFDSNVGFMKEGRPSSVQAWMWKRHAGFDVVCYEGNGVDRYISHSMNQSPEMMWFKKRNDSKNWYVYHKGLDGGSSPEDYSLRLNTTAAEDQDGNTLWNQTVPTATHFRINTDNGVNTDGDDYIAMLFASVDGISKVGYYAGSNSEQTISCGFQPRFAIIRNISMTEDWGVYDTLRGWSSGNDKYLKLNDTPAQSTYDFGQPTSTGFTLVGNNTAINKAGNNFIFYAHA